MKKYVFSHISFHDNNLVSIVIDSDLDILTVAKNAFIGFGWDSVVEENINSIDELKCYAFDCDAMIEIIEV